MNQAFKLKEILCLEKKLIALHDIENFEAEDEVELLQTLYTKIKIQERYNQLINSVIFQ